MRSGFKPWVGKIPWRRKWQSTPVLLPGKSHGQRSLVGYSLWGCKESNTTERLHFHFHFHFHSRWTQTSISLLLYQQAEKAMAPHSSTLAWKIPWTGEPGGLPSMGSRRVGHEWSDLAAAAINKGACMRATSHQSCPTLWPHGLCPPGSSVHGILQAGISEWVAMPSSSTRRGRI